MAAAESEGGEDWLWIPEGLKAIRKDGERFPIEATASRTMVSGATLFTMILRDINERKQAENGWSICNGRTLPAGRAEKRAELRGTDWNLQRDTESFP
jgi:hypothetical protein